jgi:hypothetical protein
MSLVQRVQLLSNVCGRGQCPDGKSPPRLLHGTRRSNDENGVVIPFVTSGKPRFRGFPVAGAGFELFVVVGAVAFTSAWVPGTALLSDGIEQAGIGLAIGFVLFNLAWTPGFLAGAATGGWLASAIGDSSTYLVLATLCALTLLGAIVLAGRQRRGSQEMVRETR